MDDDKIITAEEARALLARATGGSWYVADGCSWRRILQRYTDAPVLVPTTHWRDNHPDLLAERPDLELAAAAPALARTVEHLHAELAAERERADRLARVLAVESGDESAAPEGWFHDAVGDWSYAPPDRDAAVERVSGRWGLFLGGIFRGHFPFALDAMEFRPSDAPVQEDLIEDHPFVWSPDGPECADCGSIHRYPYPEDP